MEFRSKRDRGIYNDVHGANTYHLPDDMKGMKVLDIGGHIGSFAVTAQGRGAEVTSFEPCIGNFKMLKKNFNGAKFNLGVGKPGARKLYHHEWDKGSHSLVEKTKKYEVVNIVSLTQAFTLANITTCDLLKLDCEGAEFEMIDEIKKLDIKHIVVEIHCDIKDIKERFLDKLDYPLRNHLDPNVYFTWPSQPA